MSVSTNLGRMSPTRREKVSIAMVKILTKTSPLPLSAGEINLRLPDKYQLGAQQVSRLLRFPCIDFPGDLVIIQSRLRKEFYLDFQEKKEDPDEEEESDWIL